MSKYTIREWSAVFWLVTLLLLPVLCLVAIWGGFGWQVPASDAVLCMLFYIIVSLTF